MQWLFSSHEPMSQKIQQVFGEVIRRRREAAGVTQEDLGHWSGLSRNYIGMLERGERVPTILVMHKVAVALGVSMSALVRELERGLVSQGRARKTRPSPGG